MSKNKNKEIPYANCWIATDGNEETHIYFGDEPYKDCEIWNTTESLYLKIDNFFETSWSDDEPTRAIIIRKNDFKNLLENSNESKIAKQRNSLAKKVKRLKKKLKKLKFEKILFTNSESLLNNKNNILEEKI